MNSYDDSIIKFNENSVKHIHVGIELKVYIHINKDVIAPDM